MPPSRGGGIYIPTLLALGLAMWLALANDMWAKSWDVITWFVPSSWAPVICHEKGMSWELLLPEWDTWGRFKSDLQLKPSPSLSSQSPASQQAHRPAGHMFAIRRHRLCINCHVAWMQQHLVNRNTKGLFLRTFSGRITKAVYQQMQCSPRDSQEILKVIGKKKIYSYI